ncbi:hypothetical protein [Prauserella muralis]|uniref:Uncharacterized protein n=1 Tax=Prauserella muralis TaxID=588067 RepID=A0A2V4BA76_9PSEU|nr:hypothetical protein [Prauserella muralis]PXY32197.1 hypothetical protein BAY60_07865 [Prauserella muralis]TWE24145.1 hypothetical protein FHX69_5453 [Prauserella muralis]
MAPIRTDARRHRRGAAVAVSAAFGALVALPLTAAPAGATQTEEHCVYSAATGDHTCYPTRAEAQSRAQDQGSDVARASGEVIGAVVFEDENYGGSSLTITVPEPCPKNDKVDFWLDLGDDWKNRISSVQAWSSCWVWLYPGSGDRAGPYKDNHSTVGGHINDRTVTVGLS